MRISRCLLGSPGVVGMLGMTVGKVFAYLKELLSLRSRLEEKNWLILVIKRLELINHVGRQKSYTSLKGSMGCSIRFNRCFW